MKLSELIEKYRDCEVSDELVEMIKPKGDWKPKKGEKYYFIVTSLEITYETYINSETDNNRLSKRNCYKTEEEAKFALDMYNFCKERSFEPDWGNFMQSKYYLIMNVENKRVYYDDYTHTHFFLPFYYPTAEAVQEVIDKYSFDELAKYYGRV